MKKLISALLCAAMLLTAFAAIPAGAADDTYKTLLPYHYSQLSKENRAVFLRLRRAVLACKEKYTASLLLDDETAEQLSDIIFYQDPLAFNVEDITWETRDDKTVFLMEYSYEKAIADSMLARMDRTAEKLLSAFDEKTSQYSKILAIHDYLAENTSVDWNSADAYSPYGALVRQKGCCHAYAKAFSYLCAKADIRAVNVVGTLKLPDGKTEEYHMWNRVYYNKRWYNVDVEQDDPLDNLVFGTEHSYLMAGAGDFRSTHKAGLTSLEYPAATTKTNSDYFVRTKLTASTATKARDLLASQIAAAANKGVYKSSVKVTDGEAFEKLLKYLGKDGEGVKKILALAAKKTKTPIVTDAYCGFYAARGANTVTIYFMVKDSSVYNYFKDISDFSEDYRTKLENNGICVYDDIN